MSLTLSLCSALQIADIQAQIDSTVDIMHENITKVAERGERLDALQDKTGELVLLFSSLSQLCSWHYHYHYHYHESIHDRRQTAVSEC